jgi:hypothetical protein
MAYTFTAEFYTGKAIVQAKAGRGARGRGHRVRGSEVAAESAVADLINVAAN